MKKILITTLSSISLCTISHSADASSFFISPESRSWQSGTLNLEDCLHTMFLSGFVKENIFGAKTPQEILSQYPTADSFRLMLENISANMKIENSVRRFTPSHTGVVEAVLERAEKLDVSFTPQIGDFLKWTVSLGTCNTSGLEDPELETIKHVLESRIQGRIR